MTKTYTVGEKIKNAPCKVYRNKRHGNGQKLLETSQNLTITQVSHRIEAKTARGERMVFNSESQAFEHVAVNNASLWREYNRLSTAYFVKIGNNLQLPDGLNEIGQIVDYVKGILTIAA